MEVSWPQMLLRIAAAFAAGFLLGWEREIRGRPAGLRTMILASVASAIAMIISDALFAAGAAATAGGSWRPDPARLGAGILTGIGFLGGGTIMRHENFVRGVTTAATLWFATVLGLAFGCGQFALGFGGIAVALLTLLVLRVVEKHIRADWYANLVVTAEQGGATTDELARLIEANGPAILSLKLTADLAAKERVMDFELRLTRPERLALPSKVVSEVSLCPGVTHVRWS